MTILCYVFSIQMRMEVIQMGMKVNQKESTLRKMNERYSNGINVGMLYKDGNSVL